MSPEAAPVYARENWRINTPASSPSGGRRTAEAYSMQSPRGSLYDLVQIAHDGNLLSNTPSMDLT